MERLEEVIAELRLVRKEIARIGADVGDVKDIMVDMMEGKRQQRKKDAERKRTKRERDAEERLQGKIPLPDCCPVEVRDKRLEARGDFLHWAHVGMEFGRDNDVRGFFTYLALAWNQTVYHEKVITRSGNRPHIWRGNVRRRSPETWSSIFGTMTGRVTDLVLADLSGQAWFAWGFAVFYPVWQEMQTLPGFAQLPDRFSQACLLVQGGFGGYCINADTDLYFDPNNPMEDLKLMRRFVLVRVGRLQGGPGDRLLPRLEGAVRRHAQKGRRRLREDEAHPRQGGRGEDVSGQTQSAAQVGDDGGGGVAITSRGGRAGVEAGNIVELGGSAGISGTGGRLSASGAFSSSQS